MPPLLYGLLATLAVLVVAEAWVLTRIGTDEAEDEPEPLDLSYVARVVTREDGEALGESLTVSDGRVIVKAEGDFYGVPVGKVAESGEDLVASDVDWDQARDVGQSWAEDHADPMEYDSAGMPR